MTVITPAAVPRASNTKTNRDPLRIPEVEGAAGGLARGSLTVTPSSVPDTPSGAMPRLQAPISKGYRYARAAIVMNSALAC